MLSLFIIFWKTNFFFVFEISNDSGENLICFPIKSIMEQKKSTTVATVDDEMSSLEWIELQKTIDDYSKTETFFQKAKRRTLENPIAPLGLFWWFIFYKKKTTNSNPIQNRFYWCLWFFGIRFTCIKSWWFSSTTIYDERSCYCTGYWYWFDYDWSVDSC